MAMIQDVDESLRALVKRDALNGSKADVAFDAPTREWSSRRNTPTVDLYLYDIREDLEQREVMWEAVRGDSGFVTERRPPARRFKLSYLVTAWTQRPEDEHRLLSSLLSCFLRNQTMPVELITGSLVGARLPITLNIALPPPQDRSISDVWSARPDPQDRRRPVGSSPASRSTSQASRPTRRRWSAPVKRSNPAASCASAA